MIEDRKFTGIWIPAAIWLYKGLSVSEKILFLEIQSLDRHFGCIATNKRLGETLVLKPNTVSEMIKSLEEKGFISISYKDYNTHEGRCITVPKTSTYYTLILEEGTPSEKSKGASEKSYPPSEKPIHTNTFTNTLERKEEIDKESISGTLFPFPSEDVPPIIDKKTQAQIKKEEMDETFKKFIIFFNYIRKKYLPNAKGVSGISKARREFEKRLKDYSKEDISNAVENAFKSDFHKKSNYQHVTPEFILREEKLEKYATIAKVDESTSSGLVH